MDLDFYDKFFQIKKQPKNLVEETQKYLELERVVLYSIEISTEGMNPLNRLNLLWQLITSIYKGMFSISKEDTLSVITWQNVP